MGLYDMTDGLKYYAKQTDPEMQDMVKAYNQLMDGNLIRIWEEEFEFYKEIPCTPAMKAAVLAVEQAIKLIKPIKEKQR